MGQYFRSGAFVVLLFLSPGLLFAQAVTGEIEGDVLDAQTDQPIPEASVITVNLETNIPTTTMTDSSGRYLIRMLRPGTYSVTAKKEGYKASKDSTIEVTIGFAKVLLPPIKLSPLAIDIPTEPAREVIINTVDVAQRGTFDDRLITALPLPGIRTFDELALLFSGVLPPPASSGKGPGVGPGVGTAGQFSVNGQRSRSNNFTIDGSDNNDEDIGVRRQGFVALTPQSVDSVKDFQIRYGVYSAEFGRNAGSAVDVVSKSGGNEVHGSLFGFLTDQRLNARDFFSTQFSDTVNTGQPTGRLNLATSAKNNGGGSSGKDPLTRAQYGLAVGGPIVKDTTFFFVSLERQHIRESVQAHFATPPEEFRGFVSHVVVDGQVIPRIRREGDIGLPLPRPPERTAGRAVLSLYPFPNNPDGPYGPFTYTRRLPADADGDLFSVKVDRKLSATSLFTARYNFTDDNAILPVTGGAINSSLGTDIRTQNLSLILTTSISNRAANLARFSFGRTRLNFLEQKNSPFIFQDDLALPDCRLAGSYTGPIGQLLIAPFDPVGVDVFNFEQRRADNTFQVGDTFSYQVGRHNIRTGLDIRRSQLNSRLDRNFRPLVTFLGSRTADFYQINVVDLPGRRAFLTPILHGLDFAALGVPTGILQTLSLAPDSTLGLRLSAFNFFFNDNWRIHPRVTLDWGIRYELNTVPKEAHHRIENALTTPQIPAPDPSLGFAPDHPSVVAFNQSLAAYRGFLEGRTHLYEPDRKNLGPRLGIAWRVNDKTVLRAGYGIFFDQIIGSITSQSRNLFPNAIPINFYPGLVGDPNGIFLDNPFFLNFCTRAQCFPLVTQDPRRSNRLAIPPGLLVPALGALFQARSGVHPPGGIAFTLPDRHLRTPYAQHYNLAIERELSNYTTVSISYAGSRSVKLTRFRTPNGGINNIVQVTQGSTGTIDEITAIAPIARSRYPNLGAFTVFENSAASNFNSLQVSLNRWLRNGVHWTAAYTYSHTIDDVSDVFDGVGFFTLPQDDGHLRADRASASFDARHRLAISYVWELPFFDQNKVLGGWAVTGINAFQTGQPFTVNTGIDVNQDGNLNDRLDATAGLVTGGRGPYRLQGAPVALIDRNALERFLAPSGLSGRVGRNSFRAAGIATVDLALLKNFKVTENRSLEFRSEFFNLFNRTHFGIPVRILESPGFGRSVNTLLRPRQIQLALRFRF